jgi:hypothetical protein
LADRYIFIFIRSISLIYVRFFVGWSISL